MLNRCPPVASSGGYLRNCCCDVPAAGMCSSNETQWSLSAAADRCHQLANSFIEGGPDKDNDTATLVIDF